MKAIKNYFQNHWAVKDKYIPQPDGTTLKIKVIDTNEIKYAIWNWYNKIAYPIKKFFKPWNVVRLTQVDNEYMDEDIKMLHAIFQCLVDYVELEYPFAPSAIRDDIEGRYSDIDAMRKEILHQISPKGLESYFAGWESPEERARTEAHVRDSAHVNLEILYLYEWYKLKKYEFNEDLILHIDLNDMHAMFGHSITPKSEIYLTSQEHTELEEEHKQKCDHILRRVLAVRHYLWT